jgi:putative ABC transport system ATP-binding protein
MMSAVEAEPDALLAAVDLHRSFGATPALAGASIRVVAGEIVAIMGPSGSGKSTLLHCLAGILVPDRGDVVYRGDDLGAMSDRARSELRRSEFGFVFQFGQLVPELSCLHNIALPARLARVGRRAAERTAREWLDRLEVGHVADKRPGEVSGGEGRPSVVFADEPTGALDSLNGERVMRLLSDAARETGAAVVLVTHEPRVAAYADREVVVRDGRTRDLEPAR